MHHRSELTIPWITQVECLFAGFKGEEPFYRPPVHGARPSDSTELTQNWSESLWMLLKDSKRYTVRSLYCSTMFYTHDLDTSLIIIITSICHCTFLNVVQSYFQSPVLAFLSPSESPNEQWVRPSPSADLLLRCLTRNSMKQLWLAENDKASLHLNLSMWHTGHTPCLYVNKLRVAGVLKDPVSIEHLSFEKSHVRRK